MYTMEKILTEQAPYPHKFYSADKICIVNNTEILFRSGDQPDTLRGLSLDGFGIDEAREFKDRLIYDIMIGRLSNSTNAQGFITTSPKGKNWAWELEALPDTETIIQRTDENPFLPKSFIDSVRSAYTTKLQEQELNADIINFNAGLVYYPYTDLNNDKTIKYDPALPIYIGMDFNVDPMSAVLYQNYTEQDSMHVNHVISKIFKVYYLRNSNTQLLAKRIVNDFPAACAYILTPCQSSGARQTVAPIGINDLALIKIEFNGKPLRIAMRNKNPLIRDRLAITNNRLEKGYIKINPIGEGCKELIADWQLAYYKEGTSDIDWGNAMRGHACAGFDYSQEYHFRIDHRVSVTDHEDNTW